MLISFDYTDNVTEKYKEEHKKVKCPFCNNAQIDLIYVSGYYTWSVSGAAHQRKRTKYYHDPKIKVDEKCPNCGKSAKEISEALERGQTKQLSHEERLERLRRRGLPLVIEG
jgi:predicted RNA-binding Zn-ribbon protein involved in translation (DUF1610 family)